MRTVLYPVPGPWSGRLAIMPRPRGGDWLENEVQGWRAAGWEVIVSLLTPEEGRDLDLGREDELCQREGLTFIAFPIPDRSVPASRKAAWELLEKLGKMLAEGKQVAIHCRQGIGRAGLMAAGVLVRAGLEPEATFECLTAARGTAVPETAEQRRWVAEVAGDQQALASQKQRSSREPV